MKVQHAAALLVAGATLASLPALAADGHAADVAALEAADQAWVKAFNSGNADAAAALYDEKGALLPPNVPAVNGRAAIRDFLAKEMAEAKKAGIAFTLGARPAGASSGDMGWQSGSYAVKDKSGKVLEAGKYLSVSRKVGGKWLYVRDTWNADAPPPASAPPAAPQPKK